MASSRYVYVVTNDNGALITVFTVKRELASWLLGQPGNRLFGVCRCRDGAGYDQDGRTWLNPRTLRPAI